MEIFPSRAWLTVSTGTDEELPLSPSNSDSDPAAEPKRNDCSANNCSVMGKRIPCEPPEVLG